MGGHGSHPLGWTVLALVVVAYAHVILELAAAGLALAIATRVMTGTPWRPLVDRVLSRHDRRGGRGRDAIATRRIDAWCVRGSARRRSGCQERLAADRRVERARPRGTRPLPGRITASEKEVRKCVT